MKNDPHGVQQDVEEFAAVLERFHAEKHTGPVIVHFAQGCPNVVEVPAEPRRIVVTKRKRGVT